MLTVLPFSVEGKMSIKYPYILSMCVKWLSHNPASAMDLTARQPGSRTSKPRSRLDPCRRHATLLATNGTMFIAWIAQPKVRLHYNLTSQANAGTKALTLYLLDRRILY
jgi:hypothetical protein